MVDRELVNAFVYQAGQMRVTLRLGEEVERIEPGAGGTGTMVVLRSGKRLPTDLVLGSAGRQGATRGYPWTAPALRRTPAAARESALRGVSCQPGGCA